MPHLPAEDHMTKFRLALVLLCLGLLGAMPFVISQPKPDTAAPVVQRETAVQRQMAAQRQAARQQEPAGQQQAAYHGEMVRAKVGAPLQRAMGLISAGEYKQAFAILDGLDAIPDTTPYESAMIGQMRSYANVKSSGIPAPQSR
jgi:hypothetical protein